MVVGQLLGPLPHELGHPLGPAREILPARAGPASVLGLVLVARRRSMSSSSTWASACYVAAHRFTLRGHRDPVKLTASLRWCCRNSARAWSSRGGLRWSWDGPGMVLGWFWSGSGAVLGCEPVKRFAEASVRCCPWPCEHISQEMTEQGKSREIADADRDRTLHQFRQALAVRNKSDESDESNESFDFILVERAIRGIPAGRLMAARWCTVRDAIEQLGRAVYKSRWNTFVLKTKRYFPYPSDPGPFVFRKVALRMNGIAEIDVADLVSRHCGATLAPLVVECQPDAESQCSSDQASDTDQCQCIGAWPPQEVEHVACCEACIVRDPSWDIALGAYEALYEALAEGLVRAVGERIAAGPVPRQFVDGQPRTIGRRGRVDIDAAEWRRDDVILARGLVRAWWQIIAGSGELEPPWVVLVDRDSLQRFLHDYADVLADYASADTNRRNIGRPPEIQANDLQEILRMWRCGELGSRFAQVEYEMMNRFGVSSRTARTRRTELGICKNGRYERPDRAGT